MSPVVRYKKIKNYNGLFVWDGLPKRKPKAGEWFLSGALPTVYLAKYNLDTEYFIMKKVG